MFEYPKNVMQLPIDKTYINRVFPNFAAIRYVVGKGFYAHAAIDSSARRGAPYVARTEVKVNKIYWIPGSYGHRIELDLLDGPFFYLKYSLSHCLRAPEWKQGDIIPIGGVIAHVGNTGNSESSHMHLELGTDLGWNGYFPRRDMAHTRGFVPPAEYFDMDGVRWA